MANMQKYHEHNDRRRLSYSAAQPALHLTPESIFCRDVASKTQENQTCTFRCDLLYGLQPTPTCGSTAGALCTGLVSFLCFLGAVIMNPLKITKWEQLLLHHEDCMSHYLAERTVSMNSLAGQIQSRNLYAWDKYIYVLLRSLIRKTTGVSAPS